MATVTAHLVDALPYVFRAWFSLPSSMTDPQGQPVNAVYGFTDFLCRYLGGERPTHAAVAFDESLTTSFRNDLYPPYKAQRELPPPEFERQIERCQRVARALGLATFAHRRYEADDLIATLGAGLREQGHRVVVTTVDKDLTQLVGEGCQVYDWAKGIRYGPAEVKEKMGVRPEQVPDLLGLAGDAVDNIPGVKGIGPKTACALLAEFDDLDAVYADLGRVAELPIRGAAGVVKKLQAQKDEAFLSRELATVATDAPVEARLDELAWRGPSDAAVEAVFDELGFGRLRGRVPKGP